MLKKDLNKIDSVVNNHKGNVLVLSHVGPFTSNTANAYEDGLIYSGSQSLNDFLLKYENKIIGNIHGHTILSGHPLSKERRIKLYVHFSFLALNFKIQNRSIQAQT